MTQRSTRAREKTAASPSRHTTPPRETSSSLMTTAQVRKLLSNPAIGIYIGNPILPVSAQFFLGGIKGDVLISQITQDELVLRGVFQISRSNCFLSPDGVYQPNNKFGSKFEDVKLSCKLSISYHDDFPFMRNDMDTIKKNVKGFEGLIQKTADDSVTSAIQMTPGWATIKMIHPLFIKKPNSEAVDDDGDVTDQEPDKEQRNTAILGDEFNISNWPVSERNTVALRDLIKADTHLINPLPVYDIDHSPLSPRDYVDKLAGCFALVSFAFAHYHVPSSKRHIFDAVCREILILRPADALPSSPHKKRRFGLGPLLSLENDVVSQTTASSSSQTLD
ncbi:hypothetical protein EV363DRAFT_1453849 [Boletus edulis]|nr:hypothetical protein EV363DRAFT_1453849 [Boletus edulis]